MDELLLEPKEIGDNLDLEIEGIYPHSDGGITTTVSVDRLLQAQLAKADPQGHYNAGFEQGKFEERERIINITYDLLELSEKSPPDAIPIKLKNILQALKGNQEGRKKEREAICPFCGKMFLSTIDEEVGL